MQFRWQSAAITHRGKVRPNNQDAVLDRKGDGLWVVADGMGGHERGELASQTIVALFRDGLVARTADGLQQQIDTVLQEANRRLILAAQDQGQGAVVGSTVVVLALVDGKAVIGWAGDSRAYRLRHGQLQQLTEDHSQVQELVRQGLLRPEDAESHPAANAVTRAVGGSSHLKVDFACDSLADNDRFLLCSDGLTKALPHTRIADLMAGDTSQASAEALIDNALAAGARDNVSAVLVRVQETRAPV